MIPALLHGRLLSTPPAGAPILHPEYGIFYAIDTKVTPATATAVATLTIDTDGTFTVAGTGASTASGLWYNPETVGIGASYEVRITPTLTSGSASVISNPASTWVAITSNRAAQFTLQMLSLGTLTSNYSVLVEIRIAGGGATVSTNTLALTVSASVSSGGGGGGCVCDGMFIHEGLLAQHAQPGDLFDCIDFPNSGSNVFYHPLESVERSIQPSVRITTDAGAVWEGSIFTPYDLLDGRKTRAPQMLGEQVITDWGIETVISVADIGLRPVSHNHVGGRSYAAGADPFHRIYSHNPDKL